MTEERIQQIKTYQEITNSAFTDYTRFEGDASERDRVQQCGQRPRSEKGIV
jgi:hypothetical protein